MQTKNYDKILLWVLRTGIILTLLTPLIINFNFLFPYVVPRTIFFQIITEILLATSIALITFYPSYRPKWTTVSKAIILFFAFAAISTITSANPGKSFIGTIERCFGFWNISHFGFLYLAAIIALRKQKDWNVLFGISITISVYAALNLLLPVIFKGAPPAPTVAGNATFLAAYLLFHLFFAAQLLNKTTNKWIRILLFLTISIQVLAVIASGVRGAFVGLSAGIFVLILYYIVTIKRLRLILACVLIIVLMAYAFIFTYRNKTIFQNNSIIKNISDFSLQDSTVLSRLAMWRIAISGVKEKPVLGWGMENYSLVFNDYFHKSFDEAKVSEGWEDRTHNVIFDTLIHEGILGLLTYILLIGVTFYTVRKNPILMASLIAYIVQNLFGVDTINSYLPFFILIAYTNFISTQNQLDKPHEYKIPNKFLIISVSSICVLIIITSSILFTINPAIANTNGIKSAHAMMNDDYYTFKKLQTQNEDLLKLFPSIRAEELGLLTSIMYQNAQQLSQRNTYTKFSSYLIEGLKKYTTKNNAEKRWIFQLNQLLVMNAIATGEISWLDQSDKILTSLISASPERKLFLDAYERSKQIRILLTTSPSPHNPSKR